MPRTRKICNELIDAIVSRADGRSDAALDYAQHVPVRVIALLLGVPDSDGDRFRHWIHQQVESGVGESAELEQSLAEMADYFGSLVAERQRLLKDAWLTAVGHKRPGMNPGLPLEEAEQKAAGIDKQIDELLAPTAK